jgi:hypothetical protein
MGFERSYLGRPGVATDGRGDEHEDFLKPLRLPQSVGTASGGRAGSDGEQGGRTELGGPISWSPALAEASGPHPYNSQSLTGQG